jgi:hypothetical protein
MDRDDSLTVEDLYNGLFSGVSRNFFSDPDHNPELYLNSRDAMELKFFGH